MATLDPDYRDFVFVSTKMLAELGGCPTDQDQILKLVEEVGEVAEAYGRYAGSNPRKGPATGHMVPVAEELADVIMTAFVTLVKIGFDPDDMLERQMNKVKSRWPEVWDVKP